MSFGPNPWQQQHWDGRAAGNFIGGGAGAGLILVSCLAGGAGALFTTGMVIGLALVGIGLSCVWLEIGRPLRALNVFLNARTSWMSREAIVATLLFPAALAAALRVPGTAVLAAVLALAYIFCQGNMLMAARGIPAWRQKLTLPLLLSSGLSEGAGLYCVVAAAFNQGGLQLWLGLAALLWLRLLLCTLWWRRLASVLNTPAKTATRRAERILRVGSWVALGWVLVLLLGTAVMPQPLPWTLPLQALAGFIAAASGAAFKWLLITRAAFNQGFALVHLPVRGVRRS